MNEAICLALVIVGVAMILLGMWMTYRDWKRRGAGGQPGAQPESFEGNVKALTELIKALQGYPPGKWLIVIGIVVLIIAALFCGISGFATKTGS
jgi:type IV secretory pathway VirB2 component (pilin)